MAKAFNTLLGRDDLAGIVTRSLVLCLVLCLCFGLSILIENVFTLDVPTHFLIAVFLVVLFSMVTSLVLSEYPRGSDYVLMRIGFATFCRTGLPLVVVMVVARYSEPTFAGRTMGFLVAFYAVGLISSIGLSLYRFSSSSRPKSQEVDSAAA